MDNLTPPSSTCKNPAQRMHVRPLKGGVFPNARWRRSGAFETDSPANAYQSARATLSRLSTGDVLERAEAIKRHTHARWSPTDRATHDELVARCWGVGEISSLKMVGLPRWLEPSLHRISPTGRRMSRLGWRPILALVISAFRGGAAGVRLTFDELCAESGVSIATAKRHVPEMIEAGLLKKIRVFREVTGGKLKRGNDTNVYQPGPVLLANWHALLEGCSSRVPYGGPNAKRASFAAHELRQDAKLYRRDREVAARESHPSPGLPGQLRRPDVSGHEADDQGHNADAFKARPVEPVPPRGITDAELDELDAELAALSAKQSARRSSVGAAEDSEPEAPAEGRDPAGAVLTTLSPTKYQGELTTRSRSKNRDSDGPEGPRPSAGASGSEFEAAPTLERCALCRGSSADEQGRGSRCSHSLDTDRPDPWPLASVKVQATNQAVRSPSLTVKPAESDHQDKPEPPQTPIRGDELRAAETVDEAARPSTGANYDWRAGLRDHVRRGGSLRFLDPRLREELGFNDDEGEE